LRSDFWSDIRMCFKFAALALGCCILTSPAAAQDYPSRPIHLIVPFLAGGGVDAAGRIVAQSDLITTPSLMPKMPIDPLKDLVPITMISSNPFVVVATANAPFRTIPELIAAARARPGEITYATPGNGTFNHVASEWMASAARIKLQHIPYRGGAASANGVAAGDVQLGVLSPPAVQGLIDVGRVKVLALTGKERPSFTPASWPTLIDVGLPVDAVFWVGLFAPAGTPSAIVTRLEQEMARVLKDGAVRKRMNDIGIEPGEAGQAALVERIRAETARYNMIIQETGIRVEN
jgi:tripartite-type tricarboxylate transporter receptor subunit TctC